jgi:ABC-type antimicrobial peptide transport system permease subunit
LVAALILALGIGANTTIFSMLKGVILRPLPGVPHSDQIVVVAMTSRGGQPWSISYPNYKDMRDRNTVFSALSAESLEAMNVTINQKPERIWGEIVSGNIFSMFGMKAEHGRLLTPDDDRASGNAAALLPTMEAQVHELDPNLPVFGEQALGDQMQFAMVGYYLAVDFLGGAGLQGLLLAAVGIYGVIAFTVSQRTREIGIRMALGAQPRDVFRLVMGQGLTLALIGVGLGLCLAIALTGLLRSLLYGVSAHDPLTFVGVTVFLVGVGLVASFLPARRAMKIAPMEALRHE